MTSTTLRDALAGIGAYLLARRMLPFVLIGALILGCCLCQFWFGVLGLGLGIVSPSAGPSLAQRTPTVEPSQPIVPIGTVVLWSPFRIAVLGGERVSRVGASTDLVAVYLRIDNPTSAPAALDRGRIELQVGRGRRTLPLVRPDLSVFPNAPPQFNPSDPIPAGESVDAVLVFEVPRDASGLLLRVGGILFAIGIP